MAVALVRLFCYTEVGGVCYGVLQRTGPDFCHDETGKLLAEVTFPEQEGVTVINHTFVGRFSAGTGGGRTTSACSGRYSAPGWPQGPATCSYAIHWFETHPEEQDLLQ